MATQATRPCTRRTSLIALTGATAGLLAACGPLSPREPDAAGAKDASGKTPQKVVLWTSWWDWSGAGATGPRAVGLQQLVDRWNEQRSPVTVVIEPLPPSSDQARSLTDKIVVAYAAGQPPDIHDPAYFDVGLYGQNGMLVDLQEAFLKRDKEYAGSLKDFPPFLIESSYWQGKLWSLPWYTNADLPYSNLAHVREAGLQPLKLGYTWDHLVDYLKKLQVSHGPGEQTNKWAMGGMTNNVNFFNLLNQNGGEVYDKGFAKTLINSPVGIEALQYIVDLVHKHQVAVPHEDWFKASGRQAPSFRTGSISMFYETSAERIRDWAKDIGGLQNMYITPSPTKKRPFAGNYGRNILIFKTRPERQEASWGFLRWLTATDQMAHYVASIVFLPTRKSIVGTPVWRKVQAEIPQFQTFIDALQYGYRPWHPQFGKHYPMVGRAVEQAWKSPSVSAKTMLDDTARQIDLDLEDFNRRQKR